MNSIKSIVKKMKKSNYKKEFESLEKEQFGNLSKEDIAKISNSTFEKPFEEPDLILKISKVLDQKHKLDYKEKIAVFLICCTAYLPNSNEHCSCALKGNSSSGKDNLFKTCLNLLPQKDYFLLTRGTQSALEEEASKVKIVAFSEINQHRENGANSEITEFFKQLSEGGVFVVRRDQATHKVVKIKTDQKTLLYSTTECQSDEELETRYVVITILGGIQKNKIVVNSYLNYLSNPLNVSENPTLSQEIAKLDCTKDILIPYAPFFESDTIFDFSQERIKRDVKRLFAITKAITWLYQKQREIKKLYGKDYIISEPCDFYLAWFIFEDFFRLTNLGLDSRLYAFLELIRKNMGNFAKDNEDLFLSEYIPRPKLQLLSGIKSLNTLKKYLSVLKDKGFIEIYYCQIRKQNYIKACQTTCQGGINTYHVTAFDTLLTGYLTTLPRQERDRIVKNYECFKDFLAKSDTFSDHLTGVKLTPSNTTPDVSLLDLIPEKSEISFENLKKSSNLSEEELQKKIALLGKEGSIYESKPGFYQKL